MGSSLGFLAHLPFYPQHMDPRWQVVLAQAFVDVEQVQPSSSQMSNCLGHGFVLGDHLRMMRMRELLWMSQIVTQRLVGSKMTATAWETGWIVPTLVDLVSLSPRQLLVVERQLLLVLTHGH